MWQAVTDATGSAVRDSLWDYPDLMPQASDIDDPAALIERLQAAQRGEAPATDEFDEALARLLDGDDFEQTTDAGADDADASESPASDTDQSGTDQSGTDEGGSADERPEGDRPV